MPEFVKVAGFSGLALEELSDYAVSVRYDFEFWPDIRTAEDAIEIAKKVRLVTIECIPSAGE